MSLLEHPFESGTRVVVWRSLGYGRIGRVHAGLPGRWPAYGARRPRGDGHGRPARAADDREPRPRAAAGLHIESRAVCPGHEHPRLRHGARLPRRGGRGEGDRPTWSPRRATSTPLSSSYAAAPERSPRSPPAAAAPTAGTSASSRSGPTGRSAAPTGCRPAAVPRAPGSPRRRSRTW